MTKRSETACVDGLDVAIDRDAEVPIGVQLAWALRAQIRDGRFTPSQRLPGLRDLAEATGMNVNTVRAVYQRLEHEGLIDSQQGSGTFVAPSQQMPSSVGTIADEAVRRAQATGVDPREVAAALYVSCESPSATCDAGAERRRQLHAQIAGLERTLVELEAGHPGIAPASTATPASTPASGASTPRLLGADELEQVRTSLVRRLAAVQSAIDALGREPATGESEPQAKARAKAQARSATRTTTKSKRAGRSTGRPRIDKTRPAPAGA
jgi:DNA-binding transcriptional regulator YhcF (GntR family)